jgi:hypothetical protein
MRLVTLPLLSRSRLAYAGTNPDSRRRFDRLVATAARSVSVRAAYAFGDWPPAPFTFAGGDWPQGLTADAPLVDLLLPPDPSDH